VIAKTVYFIVLDGFGSTECQRIGLRRYLADDLLDKQ